MKEKNPKRLFNVRPVCFFAFFLALGIIIGEAFNDVNPLYRIIPLVAFICVAAVFFIFKKSRKAAYIPIACIIGLVALCASSDIYNSKRIDEFSGRFQADVASDIVVKNDVATFFIDNIYVDGKPLKSKGWVRIEYFTEPDYGAGDTVELDGKLCFDEHIAYDFGYAYRVASGTSYRGFVYSVKKIADKKSPFPLNVQIAIKKLFYENMDAESASICTALILGDRDGMKKELYDNIAASGLAHVLAVSGLHITLLSTSLYFLLKKLKLNGKASFIIVTVLTFVYVMLCGFTPSALRAFIMSGVFTLADSFGKKKDNLSCLSAAAILILFFSPTSLMHTGFLLSAFSMLGIFTLYGSFEKQGMKAVNKISPKRHIGKKMIASGSLALSANIMTYPIVAYFFGEVPTLFLISSVVVLPYVMIAYVLLIILTLFSLITTLGGAVGIMQYLLMPFRAFVRAVGELSFAQVPAMSGVIVIIAFSVCILLLSRFVFLRKDTKWKCVLNITSVALIGTFLSIIV